jgi:hypothetical protein
VLSFEAGGAAALLLLSVCSDNFIYFAPAACRAEGFAGEQIYFTVFIFPEAQEKEAEPSGGPAVTPDK